VHRVGEMVRAQEFADPFIGAVVHQDRAQQRLLGLQIVRRLAMGRFPGHVGVEARRIGREKLARAGKWGDAGVGIGHGALDRFP